MHQCIIILSLKSGIRQKLKCFALIGPKTLKIWFEGQIRVERRTIGGGSLTIEGKRDLEQVMETKIKLRLTKTKASL